MQEYTRCKARVSRYLALGIAYTAFSYVVENEKQTRRRLKINHQTTTKKFLIVSEFQKVSNHTLTSKC